MDMKKYAGAAFIKLEDLTDEPMIKTIAAIEESQYARPVLIFADATRVSLNKTNVNALLKAFGDKSPDWIGKRVEVYAGITKYNGAENDSVCVRAVTSTTASMKPKQSEDPAAELDDPIPF
jgi:hypothetical protein